MISGGPTLMTAESTDDSLEQGEEYFIFLEHLNRYQVLKQDTISYEEFSW